jgi:pyrimidine deaminase RibD-like protein
MRATHHLNTNVFQCLTHLMYTEGPCCNAFLCCLDRTKVPSQRLHATPQTWGPDQRPAVADADFGHLITAAEASQQSAGLTYPHPNHGATLVTSTGNVVSSTCQRAQGAPSVEKQIFHGAGQSAEGGTLYLNLETGDCHGDTAALEWLVQSAVARVVVGMRHPLSHMRGAAIALLRSRGIEVQLLETERDAMVEGTLAHAAMRSCLNANEVRCCCLRHSSHFHRFFVVSSACGAQQTVHLWTLCLSLARAAAGALRRLYT